MKLTDFYEFIPGTGLKVLALAGRLTFLLLVLPQLLTGELAEYAFLATVALLGARFAAMGLEDHLPLEIRGDPVKASDFLSAYVALQNLVMATGLVFLVSGTSTPAVLFLGFVYLAQQLLSGVVRTINPFSFELLANLHWVFFPPLCLIGAVQTAESVIGLMAISALANQFLVIRITRLSLSIPRRPVRELTMIGAFMKRGWQKCLAGFMTLANMRSLILWPKFLGKAHGADALALSLLCAEAIWQFGMVVVNRKYAKFCAGTMSARDRVRDTVETTLWLVGGLAILGSSLYFGSPALRSISDLPWDGIGLATAAYGFIAGFILCRFCTWSNHGFSWRLVALELTHFLIVGGVVALLDPAHWLLAALVSAVLLFAGALTLSILESRFAARDLWRAEEQDLAT